MPIKTTLAAALCVAALASASDGHSKQYPVSSAKLAEALAGRTAGPAVSCVPKLRSDDMRIIDEHTIIFGQGRTIYLQRPAAGCASMDRGGYSLVSRRTTSRVCQGDINEVVDLRNGVTVGSCVFEPFVPYTKGS